MNGTDYISIGIVDNDPLVAHALETMFGDRPTPLRVLWTVVSAREALSLCDTADMRPRVVMTDLQMPDMDGRDLAEKLHSAHPEIGILGMTAFQLMHSSDELSAAGMDAVIRKEAAVQEYVQMIGRITGNEHAATWQERSLAFQRMMLTDTEIAVLREYLKGRTTAATASLMHMSVGTVKTHMNNAYRKMGVHSRAEAIRICVREHLL
ncbi:response regulator transcription factor [Bifidobacterium sp. MA2]|uniref:Response regulator transcription factor n=1 Tax=Bifidobacterium santillanense TaxID=2809028 RepID=A0ABS5ULI7_9BIFI|nr:response regulator transcription factor [Bifidobacterium santillanense]MBT1171780.1 response regulator transcription factor [Bifidobacterium santillanense]